ncbi:M24 family metallopeptidase [Mycoplasma sp. P36-A1]|uniref:M24 family metallopeptidase n=1 Tax=Mycoplasma sp. P36-A1 TaxID=3252900 RepID=UPI003C2F904F
MIKNRYDRIINSMKENNINQIVVTDEWSIYYMTNVQFHTGHRMIALILSQDKAPILYIHEMFPTEKLSEDIIVKKWKDTDNYIQALYDDLETDKVIGVDKFMEARYLIPLQDRGLAHPFVVGSFVIDRIRALKDEKEIKLMENASRINDETMIKIQEFIHTYKGDITEELVKDKIAEYYAEQTDEGFSFSPIVGFGKNAADPHHKIDNTKLQPKDCVVLDIGCYKDKYASDMTRTIFYKEVSDLHREIYEIVKEANLRAHAAVKPGVKASTIDKIARDYITEMGYGKYFTHRLGHFIGMEVHEAGDISASNDQILEVDNIFTIEPGIYIYDKNIGVRLENIVIVEKEGARSLNKISLDLKVL